VTVNAAIGTTLLEILRAETGRPDLAYAGPPVPLTGGFWAELVAFSLADPPPGWPADLVARVMPDAGFARKETIVQSAASAAGFPTPVVRAFGGPDSKLGRAFMIMDRATGSPLLPGLAGATALPTALRRIRQVPDVLGSAMAGLHALDPDPIRGQLTTIDGAPTTLSAMLDWLREAAARALRDDLASAALWLTEHRRPPAPEVICHGDLHPFNVLVSGGRATVLDWTTCVLAPRAYDVAFTTLMLSEPPLLLPARIRPVVRRAGRVLARRFLKRYELHAAVTIDRDDVRWHQAVVSLRALTEVAAWVQEGAIGDRTGHPWLVSGPAFADCLTAVTGVAVRPL
jgi:aminoglycoside phosphotransferase (APT) family kinase protein